MNPKRLAAGIGVLLIAVILVVLMGKLKPKVERSNQHERPVTVDVYEIAPGPWPPSLVATGEVSPSLEIHLSPRVNGDIIWISDNLMPGGTFEKGEAIARIDPQDYEIAVQQEESKVQSTALDLEREKARQGVAQKEWALLGNTTGDMDGHLALRKPQLAAAALKAKAAQSSLTKAQLNLKRTWLRAPFDAAIVTEALDVGQLVGPNQPVAHLVGTDSFRVTVALPVAALRWIHTEASDTPTTVLVTQTLDQTRELKRTARVLKILPHLNQQTRRAQVLLAVDDPMGPQHPIPLLPGAFVTVRFLGAPEPATLKVPRVALREGHTTWLVSEDNQLRPITLNPLWQTDDAVFVKAGLSPGDRVLVTPLSLPIEGMNVSIREVITEKTAPVKASLTSAPSKVPPETSP